MTVVTSLRQKLGKLQPPSNMITETYVDYFYDMRNAEVDQVKRFSTGRDDFASLAHYIWRLGATQQTR